MIVEVKISKIDYVICDGPLMNSPLNVEQKAAYSSLNVVIKDTRSNLCTLGSKLKKYFLYNRKFGVVK